MLLVGCSHSCMKAQAKAESPQAMSGEAEILQSWQGDYPVDQLQLLPERQREQAIGFINDAKTFEGVWKAFKPGSEDRDVHL